MLVEEACCGSGLNKQGPFFVNSSSRVGNEKTCEAIENLDRLCKHLQNSKGMKCELLQQNQLQLWKKEH